jgi:polyhydroxybutyrate depolymerase
LTEWATRNGCSDTSTEERVTEHVVLLRWDDCPATAPAELYVIEGAGHTWPGSQTHAALEDLLGPTTLEIDATDLMWEFFEQFHL